MIKDFSDFIKERRRKILKFHVVDITPNECLYGYLVDSYEVYGDILINVDVTDENGKRINIVKTFPLSGIRIEENADALPNLRSSKNKDNVRNSWNVISNNSKKV